MKPEIRILKLGFDDTHAVLTNPLGVETVDFSFEGSSAKEVADLAHADHAGRQVYEAHCWRDGDRFFLTGKVAKDKPS